MLNKTLEIWGMALWVEKHHGVDGHAFIEQRIEALNVEGELGGVKLWRAVGERYAQLS